MLHIDKQKLRCEVWNSEWDDVIRFPSEKCEKEDPIKSRRWVLQDHARQKTETWQFLWSLHRVCRDPRRTTTAQSLRIVAGTHLLFFHPWAMVSTAFSFPLPLDFFGAIRNVMSRFSLIRYWMCARRKWIWKKGVDGEILIGNGRQELK